MNKSMTVIIIVRVSDDHLYTVYKIFNHFEILV